MDLNDDASAALRQWIGPETWYKRHPIDNERFYWFVDSLWDQLHSLVDEDALREHISAEVRRLHPDFDAGEAEKRIRRRVSEAQLIFDFLCAAQKPRR